MQPNAPVAFLGAFLVGLAALVGVLVSVFDQLTRLSAP
jgi:type III secretory pathway component EscS